MPTSSFPTLSDQSPIHLGEAGERTPQPGETSSAKERAAALDCLRAVGAVSVVLFHLNEIHPALRDPYHAAAKFGWLGVPIFFVVSGYCIAAARERADLLSFCARRLFRIYPPLWASLLLISVLAAGAHILAGVNDVAPIPRSAHDLTYTLLALTQPASPVPGVNWVNWSLAYEIAFYLLVGLFCTRGIFPGAMAVSALAFFLGQYGFPFDLWPMFALGIAVYLVVTKRWYSGGALAACSALLGLDGSTWPQWAAAVACAALILRPPRLWKNRCITSLRAIGVMSYSLYLTHVPIGVYLGARCIDPILDRSFMQSLWRDAILLALCLLAAAAFYRWVEEPSHRFARRFRVR